MKTILILPVVALLTGCTMDGGGVAKEDRNKIMSCKDTRDGEIFKFNTNTMTNIRAGFLAPGSFDIITLDGKSMTLHSNMEQWLKCDKEIRQ